MLKMSAQQLAHVARRIPLIRFTHGKRGEYNFKSILKQMF